MHLRGDHGEETQADLILAWHEDLVSIDCKFVSTPASGLRGEALKELS
jgi:hypothetical protein